MDGFITARTIRKKEASFFKGAPRMPIIAISADPGISLKECLESGMDGLCSLGGSTPFQEVLLAVVRHWLQEYRKSPRKSPPGTF